MQYRSIESFLEDWESEAGDTSLVLGAVTDAALGQSVADGHRSLARVAWHIAVSIPEMMNKVGLGLTEVDEHAPVPATGAEILDGYDRTAAELLAAVRANWTDATLDEEDDMYGFRWKRGFTLKCLVFHQIHHRGQMTVLMRQAGLRVPGVYGPSLEGWTAVGTTPPAV
jgi:uncharacterized damage-inducible protein DinB